MKFEGIGGVSVGDLGIEVSGQIDNIDSFEGTSREK